jgi:protein-tyrosine phosphatase
LFHFEAHKLQSRDVDCIVDLCAELPTNVRLDRPPFVRLQLPVLDRCPPRPDELARAAEWAAEQLASGRKVYVHCAFGRGRSALVAAAVMLRSGKARSADDALALVKRGRRVVRLNPSQYAALVAYAQSIAIKPPAGSAI